MRHQLCIGAVAAGLAFGLGCHTLSPAAPPEPPADAVSLLSGEQRDAARKLYVAKCARCHKFYDPAKCKEVEWRTWMDKMSRKAKLKSDQEELLSRYLDTFRSGTRTNANAQARPPDPPAKRQ